jgi:hypothetical protein
MMKWLVVLCLALPALAGDVLVRPGATSVEPLPRFLVLPDGSSTGTPTTDDYVRCGWRLWDGQGPAIAAGFERLGAGVFRQHATQPNRCVQEFVDTLIADRLAAEAVAASNAAAVALEPEVVRIGKADVVTYADGSVEIAGAWLVRGLSNGVFEVWVDADTGMVFADLDHASPRKSKVEKDAAKAAKRAKIAAVKTAKTDGAKLAALLDLWGLK